MVNDKPNASWINIAAILAISLILISSTAYSEPDPRIRAKYERTSEIPDNVYFPKFVTFVTSTVSEHDRQHAIIDLQQNMGFTSVEESTALFELLTQIKADIATERQAHFRQTICPLDRPRPSGVDVFKLLDDVDDNNDRLGSKYLAAVNEYLGPEAYQIFLTWMGKRKLGSTIIVFDHAQVHAGRNPDVVRQESCGRFDSKFTN